MTTDSEEAKQECTNKFPYEWVMYFSSKLNISQVATCRLILDSLQIKNWQSVEVVQEVAKSAALQSELSKQICDGFLRSRMASLTAVEDQLGTESFPLTKGFFADRTAELMTDIKAHRSNDIGRPAFDASIPQHLRILWMGCELVQSKGNLPLTDHLPPIIAALGELMGAIDSAGGDEDHKALLASVCYQLLGLVASSVRRRLPPGEINAIVRSLANANILSPNHPIGRSGSVFAFASLIGAVYLEPGQDKINDALRVEKRLFSGLYLDLLSSPRLNRSPKLVEEVGMLVVHVLQSGKAALERTMEHDHNLATDRASSRALETTNMLRCLAILLENSPSSSDVVVGLCERETFGFLAVDHLNPESLVRSVWLEEYVELYAAFARHSGGYPLVSDRFGGEVLRWVQDFAKAIATEPANRRGAALRVAANERVLRALMVMLRAFVGKASEEKGVSLPLQDEATVKSLLQLNAYPLSYPIKGLVQEALAELVLTTPALGDALWKKLDESQALSISGLLADADRERPGFDLRAGFAKLVFALLHCCPIPNKVVVGVVQQLADRFIMMELPPRDNPEQAWAFAESCLAVFSKLLQDFDPTDSLAMPGDDSAIALLQWLWGNQGASTAFTARVVATAHHGLCLAATRPADASLATAESAAYFALKFLALALEHEEATLKKLVAAGARAHIPIAKQLVRHPSSSEIVTLARAVGYIRTARPETFCARVLGQPRWKNANVSHQDTVDRLDRTDPLSIAFYSSRILLFLSHSEDRELLLRLESQERELLQLLNEIADQLRTSPSTLLTLPVSSPVSASTTLVVVANDLSNLPVEDARRAGYIDPSWDRLRNSLADLLLQGLARHGQFITVPSVAHLLTGFSTVSPLLSELHKSPRVSVLDALLDLAHQHGFPGDSPVFSEKVFQIIHHLVANPSTSGPFLRFKNHRYGKSSLAGVLLSIPAARTRRFLSQRGWVGKTIALELHDSTLHHRVADCHDTLDSFGLLPKPSGYAENVGRLDDSAALGGYSSRVSSQSRAVIVELLARTQADLPPQPPSPPGVDPRILVKQDLPRGLRADAAKKRAVEEWREWEGLKIACFKAFEGWSELVSIYLLDCLPQESVSILLEILLALLRALNTGDSAAVLLGEQITKTALFVMSKVRAKAVSSGSAPRLSQSRDVFALILESIVSSRRELMTHSTRANIYALFLNFVQYTKEGHNRLGKGSDDMHLPELGAVESLAREASDPRILEVVSQDALVGPMLLRRLAFVFLTALLELGGRTQQAATWREVREIKVDIPDWVVLLKRRGRLEAFIVSYLQREAAHKLREAITDAGVLEYERLQTYESLMYFLCKVGERGGQSLLVECRVVEELCKAPFLRNNYASTDAGARYATALLPALKLMTVVMAAPNSWTTQLPDHILGFLQVNEDILLKPPASTRPSRLELQTWELGTTLLYLLYPWDSASSSKFESKLMMAASMTPALLLKTTAFMAEFVPRDVGSLMVDDEVGDGGRKAGNEDGWMDVVIVMNTCRNLLSVLLWSVKQQSKQSRILASNRDSHTKPVNTDAIHEAVLTVLDFLSQYIYATEKPRLQHYQLTRGAHPSASANAHIRTCSNIVRQTLKIIEIGCQVLLLLPLRYQRGDNCRKVVGRLPHISANQLIVTTLPSSYSSAIVSHPKSQLEDDFEPSPDESFVCDLVYRLENS